MKYQLNILTRAGRQFISFPESIPEENLKEFQAQAEKQEESVEAVLLETITDGWEGNDTIQIMNAFWVDSGSKFQQWAIVTSEIEAISLTLKSEKEVEGIG